MIDHDSTFSSSLADCGHGTRALLALTLIWHPDPGRIGEQYVADAGGAGLTLSRYAPDFRRPDGAGLPLGHGAISRDCLRFTRDDADGITLVVPATRMVVQLGGHIIEGTVRLHAAQIGAGQILTLGRAIVLCLHWMPVLPRHNPVAGFVGVGKSAITVREQIRMVAPTNMPVLLLGETGTGKEVVARAIHALSDRRHATLDTVNMAALNESLALAELFGAA